MTNGFMGDQQGYIAPILGWICCAKDVTGQTSWHHLFTGTTHLLSYGRCLGHDDDLLLSYSNKISGQVKVETVEIILTVSNHNKKCYDAAYQ
jgi:hypothetical protein